MTKTALVLLSLTLAAIPGAALAHGHGGGFGHGGVGRGSSQPFVAGHPRGFGISAFPWAPGARPDVGRPLLFGRPSLLTGRSAPIGARPFLGSFAPVPIDRAQADETERARESSLDAEIDAATGAKERTQDDSGAQPAPAGGDTLQPL